MIVGTSKLKDQYVHLRVPLKTVGLKNDRTLDIQVKLDDEGVVVDAFLEGDSEAVASTWKLYQEMIDGEGE